MRLSVIHELFITSYRMNILAISKLCFLLQVRLITLHLHSVPEGFLTCGISADSANSSSGARHSIYSVHSGHSAFIQYFFYPACTGVVIYCTLSTSDIHESIVLKRKVVEIDLISHVT
jgi:hypothetical protein